MKRALEPSSAYDNPAENRATPNVVTISPPRVTRLKSLDDVRVELGKVYREARTGRLEMTDAKALAYLLTVMSALLKETALEERVRVLEEAAGAGAAT